MISAIRRPAKATLPKANTLFFCPMVDVKLSSTLPILAVTNLGYPMNKLEAVMVILLEVLAVMQELELVVPAVTSIKVT